MSSRMSFLLTANVQMSLCNMKTGKLIKENCSKKNYRDCWHRNKLFLIKIFNLLLLFSVLTRAVGLQERRCAAAVISRQPHFCSLR